MEDRSSYAAERTRSIRGRTGRDPHYSDAKSQQRDFLKRAMMRCVRELVRFVRRQARFFLMAGLAGLGLRPALVIWFPAVVDDSRLYADIATNWLQHGIYGITNSGVI